jgi:hypothetical protein
MFFMVLAPEFEPLPLCIFFVKIENILVKTLIVDLLQRHFPREDVKSISGEGGTK